MLTVNGITTHFDTRRGLVRAVNDVSLEVPSGQIVGLVGESGCGKSATIRSVLGLIRPPGHTVSGEAIFEGADLLRMSKRKLRQVRGNEIGFVAQNPFGALNPILRIRDQFHNVITTHRGRMPHAKTRAITLDTLKAVGIPGPERVVDGYAHELSGGMAQRVVIGMALVLDPRLIVADEPTTALDVTIQRQILDLMRDLVLTSGRSMLLVTHDLGVVAQYCDQVVVMYAGKVVERGRVDEVFVRPAHPYTLGLLNSVPRRGAEVHTLRGRVADLVDYPPGCPFADRCSFVLEQCRSVVPEQRTAFDGGRTVACHRAEEEVSVRVARAG
ncbi:ABC transporter ATP-binding protein [Paractinoplanes rhizophilus]|uniref:ABC transporter ATP-binding protein n=1 Tax=Paractinoplanes rhizophilus TaxID=1416877 RepID=A0ABW2HXF2_9ACTN